MTTSEPGAHGDLRNSYIMTYSGREFYPYDPKPEDVRILDIAHALALQCRFNGHCSRFYSVAQHSVIVSTVVPEEHALQGLLHDAAEAFVGDLVRPIKRGLQAFSDVEDAVHAACMKAFDLPCDLAEEVRAADDAVLVTEMRDLMPPYARGLDVQAMPLPGHIVPVGPEEAERMFLARFAELRGWS
jgi:hypothetical protein